MLSADQLADIIACYTAATPAPVEPFHISRDRDPIQWIIDCYSKNMQTDVYGVAMAPVKEEKEAVVTALTGNGPTSLANARFYAMCHEVIPFLTRESRIYRVSLVVLSLLCDTGMSLGKIMALMR